MNMKIFAFIFLLVMPQMFVTAQKPNPLLDKADSLFKLKKLKEAVAIYSNIIKSDPKNEMALKGRAYIYFKGEKLDEAERDYKEVLKINPSCSNCLANLGLINVSKNNTSTALPLIEKAITADPKNPYAYVAKARALVSEEKYQDAESNFARALSLDSNFIEALYYRAHMYIDNNKLENAKKDFIAMIRIDPKSPSAHYALGITFANEQNFDLALQHFFTAIKEDSTEATYYNAVGNVYYFKFQPDSAIDYYTRAIRLDPDDYVSYFYRSQTWHNKEDMDASCADLAETIKRIPKNPDGDAQSIKVDANIMSKEFCDSLQPGYYYQRGIAKYNLHQYKQALLFYDRGLQKFPQHSMMTSFRGNAFFALGNYKEAEAEYTKSLFLKNNLATEIQQSWNYDEKSETEKQQMLSTYLVDIYGHRAEARISLGNYAAAQDDVQEALKVPGNLDVKSYVYLLSGVLKIIEGNNNSALSEFNKSIAINPNYAEAYANRAIVKMNLAFRTKIISYYSNIRGGSLNGQFNFSGVNKSSVNTDNLEAALTDCNKALQLKPDYAYAYYIRANIKIYLEQPDYCYDLLKAEQLGLTEAVTLISEKKCR